MLAVVFGVFDVVCMRCEILLMVLLVCVWVCVVMCLVVMVRVL